MEQILIAVYSIQIGYIFITGVFQTLKYWNRPKKKHVAYMMASYMLVLLFVLWQVVWYFYLIEPAWKVLLFIAFGFSYYAIYRTHSLCQGADTACSSSDVTSVNSDSL